jgi:hypothetical protein
MDTVDKFAVPPPSGCVCCGQPAASRCVNCDELICQRCGGPTDTCPWCAPEPQPPREENHGQ